MERITLNATLRTVNGKEISHRIRAKGLVPAVCYGSHNPPIALTTDPALLAKALNTPLRRNTAITLEIDGGEKQTRLVMVKDLQFDPVTHAVLHADFYEIKEDVHVLVKVPIVLTGKPKGAADGGLLQQVTRTVHIKCLPLSIPASIEVDVSAMGIGQSIHIKDVKFPAGLEAKFDNNFTIAVVQLPQEETPAKVVAVEGAVEGAVAPVAGAAPAAEGAKDAKAGAPVAAAGKDAKAAPAKK